MLKGFIYIYFIITRFWVWIGSDISVQFNQQKHELKRRKLRYRDLR